MKSAGVGHLRPVNIVCKTMTEDRERSWEGLQDGRKRLVPPKAQTTRAKEHSHYIARRVGAILQATDLLEGQCKLRRQTSEHETLDW
jgi:hypothetical protein